MLATFKRVCKMLFVLFCLFVYDMFVLATKFIHPLHLLLLLLRKTTVPETDGSLPPPSADEGMESRPKKPHWPRARHQSKTWQGSQPLALPYATPRPPPLPKKRSNPSPVG